MFILCKGIKIGCQYNVKKPHMIFSPSTLLGDGPLWQTLFEDGHGRSLGELHCQMDPVLPGVVIRFVCYDDVFAFHCFVKMFSKI